MIYLIIGIIFLIIVITYALLKAAKNADKRIEEIRKRDK